MRQLTYSLLILATTTTVCAESIFNFGSNNTVTSGKIIINGKEVGSSGNYLKGSGKKATVSRRVSDFRGIKITGTLDLVYTQGRHSVKITGDENIINNIRTEVKGGVLEIYSDKHFTTDMPITVTVTSPRLDSIIIDGSSDVSLRNISSDKFLIQLKGTGDITAAGKVKSLTVDVFGSGDVNARELMADHVEAQLNGTGDLYVTALQSLNATVSGAGDIVYYGNPPVVNSNAFGVGDISSGD